MNHVALWVGDVYVDPGMDGVTLVVITPTMALYVHERHVEHLPYVEIKGVGTFTQEDALKAFSSDWQWEVV